MSFEYVVSVFVFCSTFGFFTIFNEEEITIKEYAFVNYYFFLIGMGMAGSQTTPDKMYYWSTVICLVAMANLGFYSWHKNRKNMKK